MTHALAANQLAFHYLINDQFGQCEKYVKEALQVSIYTDETMISKAFLGQCYAEEGKYSQSDRCFDEAIAMNSKLVAPQDRLAAIHIWAPLAVIRRMNGDLDGSKQALEEMRQLGVPYDSFELKDFARRMARQLVARGETEKAGRIAAWSGPMSARQIESK